MIQPEILYRLVPQDDIFADVAEPPFFRDRSLYAWMERLEGPQRQIAMWAALIRQQLQAYGPLPGRLLETSAFIGIGIYRAGRSYETSRDDDFPIVDGYRFGIALMRSRFSRAGIEWLTLGVRRPEKIYRIPVVELVADFAPHARLPDGYAAATFDEDGQKCGITARHVVDGFPVGRRAPMLCPLCGSQPIVKRKAPGCIDAAVVEYDCCCDLSGSFSGEHHTTAPAFESSTVELHLGKSGAVKSSVMMSLQSLAQIKSAAAPKHFLTKDYGVPGDSGSLVAYPPGTEMPDRELVGLYLGDCDCIDASGAPATYGYGLDLQQAIDILDTNPVKGIPND